MFTAPCETIKRLSQISEGDNWYGSLRFENNMLISLSKTFLVVEKLPADQPNEILHVKLNQTLIEQINIEADYKADATFTPTPDGKYVSLATTYGFMPIDNCQVWSIEDNPFDRWRDVVKMQPLTESKGAMYWNANSIALLASTAPSGCVVFPRYIHSDKPVILRDPNNENWFAVFLPRPHEGFADAAELPKWME